MNERKGHQSISFGEEVYIISGASVVGKKEGEGPLGPCFDEVEKDPLAGAKTWEQAESTLQHRAAVRAIEKAEIKNTDSVGYVMEIEIGNMEFQGEQLKELLNLPSSCFTIQRLEGEIRFLCRGIGHGMGISQYTAEQMALEGKKYEEILQYFFPEMVIEEQ